MILGVGIDIIEVARVASSVERFGERFYKRILLPDEIAYCLLHKAPAPFIAVRFAAKEAISKAFGTGIGAQLGWHDMEVRRKASGEPFVVLHDGGQKLIAARGGRAVLISLSHTQNYATAVAILESESSGAGSAFRFTSHG
jgi:holo-[acyl-carrier protein] synthase